MNTIPAHSPSATTRLSAVDAMRGFALLGIFVVNSQYFASPYMWIGVPDPRVDGTMDWLTRLAISLVFETKFYLLFSFLFGYSFTLQLQSAARDGASVTPRFVRRQFALGALGLLHAVLLFTGDILVTYALLGLLLLWAQHWSDRRLIVVAASLVVASAAIWLLLGWAAAAAYTPASPVDVLREELRILTAYLGSPATIVARHLEEHQDVWFTLVTMQGPCAFAMFLLGLRAGRAQWLARFEEHRTVFRSMAIVGLLVGVPCAAIFAALTRLTDGQWASVGIGVSILTGPFLSAAYLSLAMFAFHGRHGSTLRAMLAPAGRMSLSNYLMQSLLCAFVFYAYGLRFMGSLSPTACLAFVLVVFSLQLALSTWWMRRFAYGPVEWLVRAASLMRWPVWWRGTP